MAKGTMPRSLRIDPDVWRRALAKARRVGDTLTDIVERRLAEYADEPDPPSGGASGTN